MESHGSPLVAFVFAFAVSASAGLAALLRSNAKLTAAGVASACLNSGLMGLGVCLLWYTKYQENIYFLLGVCVLLGLGGMPAVDFVVAAVRRGGLAIVQGKNGGVEVPDPPPAPKENK